MPVGMVGAGARITKLRREEGFTLVEILVVLIIIAVLLGIAIPAYISQRDRANDAVAQADLRVSLPSIEAYFNDNGTYAGMTTAVLRASYDQALPASLVIASADDVTYCAQTTAGGRSWSRNGPAAPIVFGSC
jgi:prepilin-type N-terminal cleavage/methylation domain-containing protein